MFKLQGVKGDKERRELNQSLLQKSRELEQELAFNANRILLFEENQMPRFSIKMAERTKKCLN